MLILSKLNFCTYYQIDKKSPKNDQINQIYSQLIVKLLEYKSWQHPIQVPYHDARITSSTPAGPHALHVSKDKVLHYMAPPNQVFFIDPDIPSLAIAPLSQLEPEWVLGFFGAEK